MYIPIPSQLPLSEAKRHTATQICSRHRQELMRQRRRLHYSTEALRRWLAEAGEKEPLRMNELRGHLDQLLWMLTRIRQLEDAEAGGLVRVAPSRFRHLEASRHRINHILCELNEICLSLRSESRRISTWSEASQTVNDVLRRLSAGRVRPAADEARTDGFRANG